MKKISGVEVRIVKGDHQDVKILSKDGEYQLKNNTCFKVLVSDDSGKLRKGDLGVVVQAAGFEGNARYLLVCCEALSCINLQGAKLLFIEQITERNIEKQYEKRGRRDAAALIKADKQAKVKRFTLEVEFLRYSPTNRAAQTDTLGEVGIDCFNGERHETSFCVNAEAEIYKIRRSIRHCPGCGARVEFKSH
jgi:hypothetical protein